MKKIISIDGDHLEVDQGEKGMELMEKAKTIAFEMLEALEGNDANVSFNAISIVNAFLFKVYKVEKEQAIKIMERSSLAVLDIAYNAGEENSIQ